MSEIQQSPRIFVREMLVVRVQVRCIACFYFWVRGCPYIHGQVSNSCNHLRSHAFGVTYHWVARTDHMIIWYIGSILLSFSIVVLHYLIRQFLCATASTLPLPSVSPIGVLSADHYMYLVSLDLPTILAFSLLSTLLPVNPLPLLGLTTLVYHHLAYVPPSTGFYYPSISSYNNCCYNRSLPHATSYFGSISSHDLPILQLTSSSPPSSFDPNCSFLIRQCSSHGCFTLRLFSFPCFLSSPFPKSYSVSYSIYVLLRSLSTVDPLSL